jgi:hypothetical protein
VVRILGEDGAPRTVNLNPNLPQASINTQNPAVESIYNPTIGQYDVICDSGPSYASKRDEAANMMLALTQANPSLFSIIGDLMVKNMDWPGAEEIGRRLQAMLPPNLQALSNSGDKMDPMVLQAHMAMQQMAGQMEHMSQEITALRDQRMLEIQTKEREWYEAQTKRMDVEVKVMQANMALNQQAAMDISNMMMASSAEMPEENQELETMEQNTMQTGAPDQPFEDNNQTKNPAPRGPRVGAMTRQPNISALTSDTKPGQPTPGPQPTPQP